MNRTISLCSLIVGLMLFASCGKNTNGISNANIYYEVILKKSNQSWQKFKKANSNSYQYKVQFVSWTGWSWETTITVINGKVSKRSFELKYSGETTDSWIEFENEIGINEGGAEPLTLDQIYDKAKKEWLIKRENAELFFETDEDGLISLCGYVEKYCMDDCFIGIRISYIGPA